MVRRPDLRVAALSGGDVAVLVGLRPRWPALATGLAHPGSWLDAAGPDVAAAALCAGLLWLAAAWVGVALLAGLGTRLPGATGRVSGRIARTVIPTVLVRLVLGSTGLGLLAAPAAHAGSVRPPALVASWQVEVPTPSWPVSPAASAPTPTPPTPTPTPTPNSTPMRLPAPAPPTTSGTPAGPPVRPPGRTEPSAHARQRVHRGDSLWLLAAHRLGPHAAAVDVARYWPQIYAANRGVIGDDPSVIHPGQVLRLPTPNQETPR